jgi:DNA modification methylase
MSQEKLTWETRLVPLEAILLNTDSPRTMDPRMRNELKKSFENFSYVEPVVLNTDLKIISGNERVKTLLNLGKEKQIEVRMPTRQLSKEEADQLMLILNRVHGEFNWEKLAEFELDAILNAGFDELDLANIFDENMEVVNDDFDQEKDGNNLEVTVKTGEVYQLGNSKLAVGDSTDPELLAKLFGEEKCHIVYSDIFYNQQLDYQSGVGRKAKYSPDEKPVDDNMSTEDYVAFVEKSMLAIQKHTHKDCHWFYWNSQNGIWIIQTLYQKLNIKHRRVCQWFKMSGMVTPNIAFNSSLESCIYGTVGKPYLSKKELNLTEILNKEIGVGNRAYDDILDLIDLWVVKRVNATEQTHACEKPPTLHEKMLRRCSRAGDIIFDGFGGSGSTLIACEQMRRKCFTVEKHLPFAQLILNRYEKFSGQKAIRIA